MSIDKTTKLKDVCSDTRAVNRCESAGITTVGEFAMKYESTVTEIYGVTERAVNKVSYAIKAAGYILKLSPYYDLYLAKDKYAAAYNLSYPRINEVMRNLAVDYFDNNISIKNLTKDYGICDEALTLHMLRVWWSNVKF